MAGFRQILKLALDFQDVIDDANSSSKTELVSTFKSLILELAQKDDAAIEAFIEEAANLARSNSFFGNGNKQ